MGHFGACITVAQVLPNPTVHSYCVPVVLHIAWLMHAFKPQAQSCWSTLAIEVGNWGSRQVLDGLRVCFEVFCMK